MYEAFRKYGGYPHEGSSRPSGFCEIVSAAVRHVNEVVLWSQYNPGGAPPGELCKWAMTVIRPYVDSVRKHPGYLPNLDIYNRDLCKLAIVLRVPEWIIRNTHIIHGEPQDGTVWRFRFCPYGEPYLIKKNLVESIGMSLENIPERITNLTGPNSMAVRLTDVYDVVDETVRRELIASLVPNCVVMIDSQTGEIIGTSSNLDSLAAFRAHRPFDLSLGQGDTILGRRAELDKVYSDPSYDIRRSLPVIYAIRAQYLGFSHQRVDFNLLESFGSPETKKRIFDQLITDNIGTKPEPIHPDVVQRRYNCSNGRRVKYIYHVADAAITSPSYYPGHPNYFLFPYDIRTYKGLPVAEHCPEYIFFIKKGLIKHDQLMELIDTALETKGYDFAVTFVRPLLGLTKINHIYFLYFLSRIYQSSIADKTHAITDYCNRIISQLPEMDDPYSSIYSTYLSVCHGSPMKPVRLMVNDASSLNGEMQESLVNTALNILRPPDKVPLPIVAEVGQDSGTEEDDEDLVIEVVERRTSRSIDRTPKAPLFGLPQLRTACSGKPVEDSGAVDQEEEDSDKRKRSSYRPRYGTVIVLSDDDSSDDDLACSANQSISETNIPDILRHLQGVLNTPDLKQLTEDLLTHLTTGEPDLPPIYDDEIPVLTIVDENQPLDKLKPEEILAHLIERGIHTLNPTLCDGAALILRMIQVPPMPPPPVCQDVEDSRERTILGLILDMIAYSSGMIESVS